MLMFESYLNRVHRFVCFCNNGFAIAQEGYLDYQRKLTCISRPREWFK